MILIRKILYNLYNFKHDTKIASTKASLKAKYGYGVGVGPQTIVTDDVEIGDYSYINEMSSVENCTIGKYCSISSGVYISPFEHAINFLSTHPFVRIKNDKKRPRVTIGNDVLISLNVVILEGVKVGDGAVLGAGAVVTKDVGDYMVVGGVPAKFIKYRFAQDEINTLKRLKWWNWDRQKIIDRAKYFAQSNPRLLDKE